MIPATHPYGRHSGPMLPEAPATDRAQTPTHWKWCHLCNKVRPTKGGRRRCGIFECAGCLAPNAIREAA